MSSSRSTLLAAALLTTMPLACDRDSASTNVPASASSTVISMQDIDCQSCGGRVVETLEKKPGVYAASFDRNLAELTVQYDPAKTSTEEFLAVVSEYGYTGLEGAGQGSYVPEVEFDPAHDVAKISKNGEAVDIDEHVVPGKVTVFDFYAVWCKPCRQVDHHMKKTLAANADVALRKINVVDWDSEVAKKYLANVADLPYVIVYGTDGKVVKEISGLKLNDLDEAIEKGRRQ